MSARPTRKNDQNDSAILQGSPRKSTKIWAPETIFLIIFPKNNLFYFVRHLPHELAHKYDVDGRA
jgi:hypothetical protein